MWGVEVLIENCAKVQKKVGINKCFCNFSNKMNKSVLFLKKNENLCICPYFFVPLRPICNLNKYARFSNFMPIKAFV